MKPKHILHKKEEKKENQIRSIEEAKKQPDIILEVKKLKKERKYNL